MTYHSGIPPLLHHYLDRIRQVRRAPLPTGEYAPHKPVLLLTLIDLVETLDLRENRFPPAPLLFSRFDFNWRLLVDDKPARMIFRPLYHLQSDSPLRLSQFRGRAIRLPANARFHPDPERLRRHRESHGL